MAPPTSTEVSIPFFSYDKHQQCIVYAIKSTHPGTRASVTVRRRFNEFVRLRGRLDADAPDLPSRVFGTAPEQRAPVLELWLQKVFRIYGVSSSQIQEFVGWSESPARNGAAGRAIAAAVPREAASRDAASWGGVSDETRRVGALIVAFLLPLIVTAAQFVLVDPSPMDSTRAAWTALLGSLLTVGWIALAWRAPRVAEESGAEEVASGESSKDVSITDKERSQLRELRERLADFASVENTTDEVWLKEHEAVATEWPGGLATCRANLKNPALRQAAVESSINVDRRLVSLLRNAGHDVGAAETQTRDALASRVALHLDGLARPNDVVPQWVMQYALCPVLKTSIESKEAREESGRRKRMQELYGRDKQGNLCMFARPGPMRTQRFYECLGKDGVKMHMIMAYVVELIRGDLELLHDDTNGAVPSQITLVADMSGFALAEQMGAGDVLPMAKKFVPIFSTVYAGILKRVIVLNAPSYISFLMFLIRPFVPKAILDTILIHRDGDVEKHVKPYIDEEYIPGYLGGKMTGADGDPFCLNKITPYGPFLPDQGESLLVLP